ncbi:MAG: hypothetical protein AMK70_15605 [Nitrospira bacterium SG8_35_1]|nr:MAG: hypothetical protein AMK70_15605 [Nitrospira bacterium SG8_35_1]
MFQARCRTEGVQRSKLSDRREPACRQAGYLERIAIMRIKISPDRRNDNRKSCHAGLDPASSLCHFERPARGAGRSTGTCFL